MALANAYLTTDELTTHLSSMGGVDADDILNLETAIGTASRWIDQHCRRRFYADTTTSTRRYRPEGWDLVYVDDIADSTGLVVKTDTSDNGTFDTTWSSSDYELEPFNQLSTSGETWPYLEIRAVESRWFPCTHRRPAVEVEAVWGWPGGAPQPVVQACLILAARLYRRRQSPEGVVGFGEFGPMRLSRTDPDVASSLAPYCKVGVLR